MKYRIETKGPCFTTFFGPYAFFMSQHVDLEPVRTERPGELTAYYKIASRCSLTDVSVPKNLCGS